MSYDLAVWCTDRDLTRDEAWAIYEQYCEENDDAVTEYLCADERIAAFAKGVYADYPDLDDVADDASDDCPWSFGPCNYDDIVDFNIVWSQASSMGPYLLQQARIYGLGLLDPQTGVYYPPPPLVATQMQLESPHLLGRVEASPQVIEGLVTYLPKHDDPYLILADSDHVYMQTLWTETGYLIEYRDGGPDKHFGTREDLSAAACITTLVDYASGGSAWRTMHRYSRVIF